MSRLIHALLLCAVLGAAAGALAAPPPGAGTASEKQEAAQTIVHLLDYIGVDYPEAVENGRVKNEDEYKEMQEFTGQVLVLLKSLPPVPQQPQLVAQAQALGQRVIDKVPPPAIAAEAARLRWAVIAAFGIQVAPRSAPDLAVGAKLYRPLCAACHGAEGKGDGPAGAKLEPAPSSFHDAERMAQRSAYGLYNTISLGVAGTGMTAYKQLSDDERWALAFYVAGLSLAEARKDGEKSWHAGRSREAFPDLASVATLSANDVKEKFGPEAVAAQAWLLAHPQALAAGKPGPIAFSLRTLRDAAAAYRKGDRPGAQKLAITAYLEGFELVEASLRNVDPDLVAETEREMMAIRSLIQRGAPVGDVEQQLQKTSVLLERAQARLGGDGLSAGAAFASALLILLREGLEAILVLAAIIAFLVKAGRRDALPYVHAGWGAAVALGAVTWFVATYAFELSGANREITEGVTALLAAAMLVYVGFWLHSRAYAQAWNRFIREQVGAALEKRTLWAMAGVSFLAVYRELFEIVLFYQALWAQTSPDGRQALFGGIGAAAVLLAVIGWTIFKYSVRLAVGPFFAVMSVLLALMAIVFAGHGAAALQEAGILDADPVTFVAVPALGLYPTLQTIGTQLAVLVIVIGSFYLASRGDGGKA